MQTSNRISFIDYLKIFLSFTVIAHHAGQPYGGSDGFWYVMDKGVHSDLGPFFGINSAFNMSLYFLISAYFIPKAFEKKGSFGFLKDRLQRIGVPLLFGFLVLIPSMMYFYYMNFRGYEPLSFFEYYKTIYLGFSEEPLDWTGPTWPDLNFGHLWFIEHLLIYSLLYIGLRGVAKRLSFPNINFKATHIQILIFILFVSGFTFFIRIWHQIDEWTGAFGFIQIEYAHLPQYMGYVVLGIIAAKNKWIHQIPKSVGRTWLSIGILLILLNCIGLIPHSKGGLNEDALIYAIYETMLCTGLSIGLLELFHWKFRQSSKLIQKLAGNTYCVYIIHIPVLMVIQFILVNVAISGYIKFALAIILGLLLSHLIAYFIVRKIPIISLLFSGSNRRFTAPKVIKQKEELVK